MQPPAVSCCGMSRGLRSALIISALLAATVASATAQRLDSDLGDEPAQRPWGRSVPQSPWAPFGQSERFPHNPEQQRTQRRPQANQSGIAPDDSERPTFRPWGEFEAPAFRPEKDGFRPNSSAESSPFRPNTEDAPARPSAPLYGAPVNPYAQGYDQPSYGPSHEVDPTQPGQWGGASQFPGMFGFPGFPMPGWQGF